jgi:DNA-binding NarL/FixJ family response regulator
MPKHLRKEEIVTIQVLNEKGENNCQVARLLGVSESTVRYHLGRAASGAVDGRQNKPFKAEAVTAAIAAWIATDRDTERPA